MASQGSNLMNKRKRLMTLSQKERKSPVKKKSFHIHGQVKSSQELMKMYQIKREQVAAECKKDSMQNQGHNEIAMKKKVTQPTSSSKSQELENMLKTKTQTQGRVFGQNQGQKNVIDNSSQSQDHENLLRNKTMAQGEVFGKKKVLSNGTTDQPEPCTQEEQNLKRVKRVPICPSMSLDRFLEKEGVQVEEGEQVEPAMDDVDDEGNDVPLDDNEAAIDLFDDDDGINHEDDNGTIKKKRTRGRTTCKKTHARTTEERVEIIFDQGQAVGPTKELVSNFSNFLGTIARNTSFVTLAYTSWHGVPDDNKNRMWKYVNSKFIIPEDGKKWVMSGICDAWKRYKGKIKKNHFDKYDSEEDMLQNRPTDIPEVQFRKLIKYWSLPTVKAICQKNSENRKKQKWAHRMGPINFGIVRTELRAKKENNEEPKQSEMFIATRTSRKGKEVDSETQAAISHLQNLQDVGENYQDAFEAVLGKEKPGRVCCFGRSITTSGLKKDEEIRQIKRQHDEKVTYLESHIQQMSCRMDGLCNLVKVLVQQNNPGMSAEEVAALLQAAQLSPPDANSAQAVARGNVPHSSESSYVPINENAKMNVSLDDNEYL